MELRIGNSTFGTQKVELTHIMKLTHNVELTQNFEIDSDFGTQSELAIHSEWGTQNLVLRMVNSLALWDYLRFGNSFRM